MPKLNDFLAAKKAVKSEKLETTIRKITPSAGRQPLGNSTRSSAADQTWQRSLNFEAGEFGVVLDDAKDLPD